MINFKEQVKALALFSSLLVSWEVFCTTFANNCLEMNLDKTIGQVLTEDIRQKSMGLIIDKSAETHNSTGQSISSTIRENKPREWVEIPINQDIGKIDND